MADSGALWGTGETQHFYSLTPERILDSVERFGLRCTGRSLALNSMENRVYEVEVETHDQVKTPSDRFRVAKFYRPGRWSRAQILEEHRFLLDLVAAEIPAVAPLADGKGETLLEMAEEKILFSVFPKRAGRCFDELADEQLAQVGRLVARMHGVGSSRPLEHRLTMNIATFGEKNLEYLIGGGVIPEQLRPRYESVCKDLFAQARPRFEGVQSQRIHGDAHVGNLLWNSDGQVLVDFDDVVHGPPVQDIWLLVPGRDEDALRRRERLIEGYEQMRDFDRSTLNLIEPLRSLRMIHFSAWIAKRWSDPAFTRGFPAFGTERYWVEQVVDLSEQLELIRNGA